MSRVKRVFPDLPFITASTNTKIIVTDADNYALGYTHINTLIDTIDSGGLATDGANIFNGNQIVMGGVFASEYSEFYNGLSVDGNLNINGDIYVNNIISSSILYQSGSTKFGDSLDDTHTFTGSVQITGSLHVNTHPVVLGQLSWARYDDTQYTTSSFRSVTVAGGEVTIPNNGGYSVTTHLHSDIQFYNTGSQRIYPEKEGDVYVMTVTFKAKTANANAGWMRIQLDSTGLTPYRRVGKDLFFGKGNDEWHDYHEVFQFYADTDFVANGNQWKIKANGATVDIANVIYFIQRTQNHLI
jgi:hypothetical protein